MESPAGKSVRIVGGKNVRSFRDRFDRLQRTAQMLSGGVREPRGVYRFQSWEEFNEWKMSYQIQAASPPPTIS
ncbi:hypothetical protein BH20VER3_BH20VER3_10800 [soil metagenome]